MSYNRKTKHLSQEHAVLDPIKQWLPRELFKEKNNIDEGRDMERVSLKKKKKSI